MPFVRITLAFVVACCVLSTFAFAADQGSRPNVLFLAIDDLNDWTGFLGGHPQSKTPNLDKLAKRGTVFTRAYCSAPACNPSRASLLTGIRPSTSGVYHNSQPWRPVLKDAITLPQSFMKAGYRVIGGGKLFHGRFKDPESWQTYYDRPADPLPRQRPVNGIKPATHFDWGPVPEDDAAMGDHQVVDWAIRQLKRKHDKPLFLAVGLFRPHLPWYAPQKYFDQFPVEDVALPKTLKGDLDDVPAMGSKFARPERDHRKVLEGRQWSKAVQGYLASIAFTDYQVGRLIGALDASSYAKNTIIVVWGDHGWHLGEKEHWRKFALWEEATRVPLIIAAPKVGKADQTCSRPVSLLDIYPTLSDLCDLPRNGRLEGKSLKPLLADVEAPTNPVITTHGRNNHAARSERWRYIRYADGTEELYDHEADPNEWTNLAGNAKFASTKSDLAKWLPTRNVPDAPGGKNIQRATKNSKTKKGNKAQKKSAPNVK